MLEQKTQQFAKFFLKDIKVKLQKDYNKNDSYNKLNISSDN